MPKTNFSIKRKIKKTASQVEAVFLFFVGGIAEEHELEKSLRAIGDFFIFNFVSF